MILAVDPEPPRRPLPITVCDRCRATEAACEARRPCCPSCDHDHNRTNPEENR